MKNFKRLICLILVSVIMCSSVLLSVDAAFYTKIVSDNSEITNILNIIKNNDGKTVYDKIYYLFYTSDFAAAYNKKFPYPNSGNSVNKVVDKNVTYTFPNTAKGCYLYADYVSRYVYNIVSWDSACKSVYITKTGGSMTAAQVKSTIQTYAQAGEHIRIDSKHSIAFLAYTDAGFYYMDYMDDSNPKIFIRYTTWQQFANQCNSYGKWACIYDVDRSTNDNSTSTTVTIKNDTSKNTITDTNAILWGWVDKPSSYTVTKIGIRVRKDSNTYDNGWSKYESPSSNYAGESYMQPYYNMNTELNVTLTHATKYYYQIYAVVNGGEYWSNETAFTTTGSHSYGAWTTTTAATCTAAGTQTRTCSCGKKETQSIAAKGHEYETNFTVDKVATCAEVGSKSRHCIRCSARTEITEIAKLEHTYTSNYDDSCDKCGELRALVFTYRFYDWTFDFDNATKLMSEVLISGGSFGEVMKALDKGLIESKDVLSTDTLTLPDIPERDGYIFTAWKILVRPGETVQDVTYNMYILQAEYEALSYVSGDLNNDGKINGRDYGMLMQYLNGWDVTINVDAADVNSDGKINGRDYGMLMQYLNGWDVELK